MKIRKYFTVAVLLLSLVPLFSSCTRSEMTDYSELNRRLKRENTAFAFSEEKIFYSSGVYFAPYSLVSEEDMLLAMCENEKGQLVRVSLTARQSETPEETEDIFMKFALGLINAYVPEKNAEKLREKVRDCAELLFTNTVQKAQSGRYTLWLSSNTLGVSLLIFRE